MLYSPVQSYTHVSYIQSKTWHTNWTIYHYTVCATSYIEMSSIQSLYMLYSIGDKYHGKLIIVIIAMVDHITFSKLWCNIKSFWHYYSPQVPVKNVKGLNITIIIITDPHLQVKNNHMHYKHFHHVARLKREFIGLQRKTTTTLLDFLIIFSQYSI